MKVREIHKSKDGSWKGTKGEESRYNPIVKEMLGYAKEEKKRQRYQQIQKRQPTDIFDRPISKDKERQRRISELQRQRIEKEKQILQKDENYLRINELRADPSSKKFRYNLDEILNQNEMNRTFDKRQQKQKPQQTQWQYPLRQRQYRNDQNYCNELESSPSFGRKYQKEKQRLLSTGVDKKQSKQQQENKTMLRNRQVDEIRLRNKTCYNESKERPSIDQIRKKYGYRYQFERENNKDENQKQKQVTNKRQNEQNQKRHTLSYQYFQRTQEDNKQKSQINPYLTSQIVDYKDERYSNLNRNNKIHQEFIQDYALTKSQHLERERYEMLKQKYSYNNQQNNNELEACVKNQRTSFLSKPYPLSSYTHTKQRIRKQYIPTVSSQHQASFPPHSPTPTQVSNTLFPQDYQQAHRTLQTAADWMKKSICDLDAKINQKLSRIIPENRYYKDTR